jgi:hypothetical protein
MARPRTYAAAVAAALFFLISSASAFAQSTITARGTVRDVSGAPLSDATVEVVVAGRAEATARKDLRLI